MNRAQIEARVTELIEDENKTGWDIPAKFLMVMQTSDLGEEIIKTTIEGEDYPHPLMYLRGLYSQGIKLPENVIGIGLLSEGWAHMDFDEAVKTEGHLVQEMYTEAMKPEVQEEAPEIPEGFTYEEAVKDYLKSFWETAMMKIQPSAMPEGTRLETRNGSLEFRDGSSLLYFQVRDREIKHYWGDGSEPRGRISDGLKATLKGENPDPDGDFDDF